MPNSKPPSRRRYEKENPTVSFRISKEKKEELDSLVEGLEMTKKEWFEDIIADEAGRFSAVFQQGKTKGEKKGREEGYEQGYEEGRKEAYEEFVATVPCKRCGEPVAVDTDRRKRVLYETIEKANADWSNRPPPDTFECDIAHDACRNSR